MSRFILITVFLLGSLSFGQGFSKISDPTSCKNKINSKAKSTQSISANFTEEIHSSMFNSVKKAKGILRYKKNNKIRWEHTTPRSQIVLINGDKMKMKENGKVVQNVKTNQVMKKVQNLMMQLFSGDFLNEKEFSISYLQNGTHYKLVLKPKSSRMSKYISQVEMTFNKKTIALTKMALLESEQDQIVYSFNSVKFNTSIAESQFNQF